MGKTPFQQAKDLVAKAKPFGKQTFEAFTTYENYYLLSQSSLSLGSGKVELKLPPGNYEIEASAILYNDNSSKKLYGAFLDFFLDDHEQFLWEGGRLAYTTTSKPYKLSFKTFSCFSTSKTIKWRLGSDATKAFHAETVCIMARRIGAIKYKIQ